jgi:hypothetical protein
VELVERKEEVRWVWSHFLVSQRRICELLNVAESSQRYVSRRSDEELRTKLVEAAREKPRVFARRVAALRSPTAPCAPQLGERAQAKVMSSGDFGVV